MIDQVHGEDSFYTFLSGLDDVSCFTVAPSEPTRMHARTVELGLKT